MAIFICCCLGICTTSFICSQPLSMAMFFCRQFYLLPPWAFVLPMWIIAAHSVCTGSLNSLLPSAKVSPLVFAPPLLFVTFLRCFLLPVLHCWFCATSFLLPVSYGAALGVCTPSFIDVCSQVLFLHHQFHSLLCLTFALPIIICCGPSIFMLPGSLCLPVSSCLCFGCSPPFATGLLHIINFWLFACKHCCCAIGHDSGWWWVLTFVWVSNFQQHVNFYSFVISLDFINYFFVFSSKFRLVVHTIHMHICMYS